MPIYEYRCGACDHLAEVIHGINDPGPRFCESCGAENTMRKGFGLPAVLYKGSGWARKDRPSRTSGSPSRTSGGDDGGQKGGATGTTDAAGNGSASRSKPAAAGGDD